VRSRSAGKPRERAQHFVGSERAIAAVRDRRQGSVFAIGREVLVGQHNDPRKQTDRRKRSGQKDDLARRAMNHVAPVPYEPKA
jgi:hypothetical protein